MKIKEIITKVDKSPQFKSDVCISKIAEEMNIYDIHWGEQDRLTSYFIGNWYCTDSYVGYRVYFFDDEPCAISSQLGRKMGEDFEWVSKEIYNKVKDYVLTFAEPSEDTIPLCDMDEDIGETYKIDFNGQMFKYHLDIPLFNGQPVKIIRVGKPDKGYDINTDLTIQFEDGITKEVEISELDFPYNIK
jgi:hypothetical protein